MELNEAENKAEVGYELRPKYQGNEVASEVLSKIIEFGCDIVQLIKIEAYNNKENHSSTKLLENFGVIRDLQEKLKLICKNMMQEIYHLILKCW